MANNDITLPDPRQTEMFAETKRTDDAFDTAEFYDARNSEVLSHRSPEEAITDWLESWMERGCDVVALIREHTPITVTAHNPETVTEEWAKGLAESLLERLDESFSEDFGDPNGNGDEIDGEDLKEMLPAMTELVMRVCSQAKVWRCEIVAEREYSAEEVEAMMREHNPEWFEENSNA